MDPPGPAPSFAALHLDHITQLQAAHVQPMPKQVSPIVSVHLSQIPVRRAGRAESEISDGL